MAQSEREGTGHHPHKSSEEPYPHHEAPTTRNEGREDSGSHRASERSESSRESEGKRDSGRHSSEESQRSSRSQSGSEGESDLKSREYRAPDGEIHHHTTTYMEQHEGEGGSKRGSASETGRKESNAGESGGRKAS